MLSEPKIRELAKENKVFNTLFAFRLDCRSRFCNLCSCRGSLKEETKSMEVLKLKEGKRTKGQRKTALLVSAGFLLLGAGSV